MSLKLLHDKVRTGLTEQHNALYDDGYVLEGRWKAEEDVCVLCLRTPARFRLAAQLSKFTLCDDYLSEAYGKPARVVKPLVLTVRNRNSRSGLSVHQYVNTDTNTNSEILLVDIFFGTSFWWFTWSSHWDTRLALSYMIHFSSQVTIRWWSGSVSCQQSKKKRRKKCCSRE